MKPTLVLFTLLLSLLSVSAAVYKPQAGDIIFQSLPHNPLVDSIEGVSQSPLSHCGVVVEKEGQWYVLEALGKVSYAPLDQWTRRGRKHQFLACRFKKSAHLDTAKFVAAAAAYTGRNYDFHYAFGNEEIYCSELPFLAYKDVTGKSLGQVRKLGEMNWRPHEKFIRSMENGALPLDREMITPVDLSKADDLDVVYKK